MIEKVAGINLKELDRLSDGVNLNLTDEVVSYVRLAFHVSIFDAIEELRDATGASDSDIQDAFNIAYKDHRISVDKDGFVQLVNSKKRRASFLKSEVNPEVTKQSALKSLVARFNTPMWVGDSEVWHKAVASNNPDSGTFWDDVCSTYSKGGGRILRVKEKTAEFQPRPFDIHAPIWTVTADGFLTRDLQVIQSFIADGVEPGQIEKDLIDVGASAVFAKKIVNEAINFVPLI